MSCNHRAFFLSAIGLFHLTKQLIINQGQEGETGGETILYLKRLFIRRYFVPDKRLGKSNCEQESEVVMLKHISWSTYLITVALLTGIYYLVILIRYYATDLKDLVSGKRKFSSLTAGQVKQAPQEQAPDEFDETNDETFDVVEEMIGRLKLAVAAAASIQQGKEALLAQLRTIFRDYEQLDHSPFLPAIFELVTTECDKTGAVTLGQDEVAMVWQDKA